jgi:hypothetical protein
MARWSVSAVTSIPKVWDTESGDPAWYPLQHALGIDTFGVNLFVATSADQLLVEEHDERASGQQELYLVIEGQTVFELDGEELQVDRGTALAVTDPSVRRAARAVDAGAALLIVGAGDRPFESSWDPAHFSNIPRPD